MTPSLFESFAFHALVRSRDFDYRETFSWFYDTDDEILRQKRNLACVIYFGLPPREGKKQLTAAVFIAASGI